MAESEFTAVGRGICEEYMGAKLVPPTFVGRVYKIRDLVGCVKFDHVKYNRIIMLILQTSLKDDCLWLWAETRAAEATGRAARRGRKSKQTLPAPLPFAANLDQIAAACPEMVPPRQTAPSVLWLPTVDGQPLASTSLIADPPASSAPPRLTPWSLPTYALTTAQTLDLLARCLDRDTLAPGVLIGSTLTYWAVALRFAGTLVAREQFLPSVVETEGNWRACWTPILAGPDRQHVHRLTQAMPAACRAVNSDAQTPPTRPAGLVLEEFMGLVVDALVRSATVPTTVTKRMPRRPAKVTQHFDSIHDQWLHALRSPEGGLQGTEKELSALAEQVRTWKRPATVATVTPFRLCFRLEEPADADGQQGFSAEGNWTVRYLLQGQDDPSLLIPVADAWKSRGRAATALKRDDFRPHEYLLTALGQAAGMCPPIEASLKSAEPSEFEIDTGAAHRFLTETAWMLEQAGFGVLLPAWWTRKGTKQRLTLSAHVKSPSLSGGSGLSLEEIVKFDWQVALGDHSLSLRELEMLAKLKTPLVRVRGQWVQVSAEEIQAALDFWKQHGHSETTVRDLLKIELGAAKASGGLAVRGVTATGWIKDLLEQLQGRASFAELPPPTGFRGTLRPYQLRGYSWLAFLRRWGLGACLADDMGLGKTVQTLASILRDRQKGEKRPVLLICPMSVVGNWKKEAERFTPELPVLIHHGLKRTRGAGLAKEVKRHALVISSYALLHRDQTALQEIAWAGVVLDEAQNIKNPNTKQAQAARALKADYRIALTGTPVENHIGDLWSIGQFLNPGFLGTQTAFRQNFFVPIQVQHDPEATERLKRLTGPFLLRRLKTDKTIIADLPDKLEMKVFCNLTKEQASLYAAVVKELDKALNDSEGIQRKGIILGTLSKLKQVCNHPAQFLGDNSAILGRSGKLARLTEMLEEILDAGDRTLIFTQFTEMGDIIRKHLQETFGREVLFLHGGVPQKNRDQMVARFQEANGNGPRVFLLSLKAGGTGLNLTAANHVFHFDRWWNPAVENQATDRAFRIGQKRDVQVHKFVCVGTLEEKIDEMIERKKEVASRVVGTGEAWLTELSNEDIKDIFTLRQEALGE